MSGYVRKLTESEIRRFPSDSSVDVAIWYGGVYYYGDSNPTEEDPSGMSTAQFVTDEDGDYIPVD